MGGAGGASRGSALAMRRWSHPTIPPSHHPSPESLLASATPEQRYTSSHRITKGTISARLIDELAAELETSLDAEHLRPKWSRGGLLPEHNGMPRRPHSTVERSSHGGRTGTQLGAPIALDRRDRTHSVDRQHHGNHDSSNAPPVCRVGRFTLPEAKSIV